MARAFAFLRIGLLYVAYLDEFGHIGPFLGRKHKQYNASPVFGLGGVVLPYPTVRNFATFFFQLKCNLLKFEIEQDAIHPAKWEKKGAALYTTQNVTKYPELRSATNRYLNRIQQSADRLHMALLKARDDMKLRYTHEGFRQGVELCVALQEAIGALKKAIVDHDVKAAVGADTRRLMADLRRSDDVPAGRYAELASALRNVPSRERRAAR